MAVTALCSRLMISVVVLVAHVQNSYCAQKDGAAFPRILPNRLQFFEYDSITFNCEFDDSAEWRVMRTLKETPTNISNWVTSAGSGTIKPAFSSDSGEYWCEDGDGLKSNAVNITVTAGSVFLESPVLPVEEGDNVTLHCQKKKSSSDLIADFYKDGLCIKTGYKGSMTLYNVSTSEEGLYKCNISGAGQSPESRLLVREPDEGTRPSPSPSPDPLTSPSPDPLTPLWIAGTSLLVALLLLVLGLGLLKCRTHRSTEDKAEGSTTRVSGGDSVLHPQDATYAVVKKPRRGKDSGGDLDTQHNVTYASVKRKEREPSVSKAATKPCLPEDRVVYSSLNFMEGNISDH
ncbi:low affinity immunoglobulin gamma Fc region receptor III-A-like [Dicentrarchus labrax]|uniref:Ig-like domain-containing protein n=1 Tax=Dicentrarchus labrax TaxID=13489 RepID=A0A8P4GL48_DICLA|nr:low affinity immunoglobulin gamma Fc region receptor III-A-like [Dicentrarchus labrax]